MVLRPYIAEMVARGGIEPPTRGLSEFYVFDSIQFFQQVTGTSVAPFAALFTTMHDCSTQNSRKELPVLMSAFGVLRVGGNIVAQRPVSPQSSLIHLA